MNTQQINLIRQQNSNNTILITRRSTIYHPVIIADPPAIMTEYYG